ncbi:MAG: hypothetical protein Q7S61_03925 [bacterium]|nr:hypothetical protein [bacterium]
MQTKSIQKFITFSPELFDLAVSKAARFGMSIGEYVRYLIYDDVKKEQDSVPLVNVETEKRIGESLAAYKKGNYITVRSDKELKEYFENL